MTFRIRWTAKGNHVHMRLFAGTGYTLGKCGDLCMTVEEFCLFRQQAKFIQFIEEE